MSADKYQRIFSRQMEIIVYLLLKTATEKHFMDCLFEGSRLRRFTWWDERQFQSCAPKHVKKLRCRFRRECRFDAKLFRGRGPSINE